MRTLKGPTCSAGAPRVEGLQLYISAALYLCSFIFVQQREAQNSPLPATLPGSLSVCSSLDQNITRRVWPHRKRTWFLTADSIKLKTMARRWDQREKVSGCEVTVPSL